MKLVPFLFLGLVSTIIIESDKAKNSFFCKNSEALVKQKGMVLRKTDYWLWCLPIPPFRFFHFLRKEKNESPGLAITRFEQFRKANEVTSFSREGSEYGKEKGVISYPEPQVSHKRPCKIPPSLLPHQNWEPIPFLNRSQTRIFADDLKKLPATI